MDRTLTVWDKQIDTDQRLTKVSTQSGCDVCETDLDQAAENGEKVVNKAAGYDEQLLTTLGVKTQLEYANHENLGHYEDEKPTAREVKLFGKVLRGFAYNTEFNIQLSEVATVYAISRIDAKQAKMHTDYMAAQNAFLLTTLDKEDEERDDSQNVSYLEIMRNKDTRNSMFRPHQLAQINLLHEFLKEQVIIDPSLRLVYKERYEEDACQDYIELD